MTDQQRDADQQGTRQGPRPRMSRRSLLRWGVGGSAGLVAIGRWGSAAADDRGIGPQADLSEEERNQIEELARRIRAGEVRRLRGGTVVVDGWFLSREHVERIERIARLA